MHTQLFFLCTIPTLAIAGCSQLPSGPSRPSFNPSASGDKAIELYDANGDGKIDQDEAEKSPGLLNAFPRVDQDGDSALTADEIADRVRYYKSAATTIVDGGVDVTVRGRPLAGATVTFEPEPFLGDAFTPCSGETNASGIAYLEGANAEFPGIYLGMYTVRISKTDGGKEVVPKRYNTESTLGYEAADDLENVSTGIKFDIRRK